MLSTVTGDFFFNCEFWGIQTQVLNAYIAVRLPTESSFQPRSSVF